MDGGQAPQTHRNSPTPTFFAFSPFKRTGPRATTKKKCLEEPRGVLPEPQSPRAILQRSLSHKEPAPSPRADAMKENNGPCSCGETGKPPSACRDPLESRTEDRQDHIISPEHSQCLIDYLFPRKDIDMGAIASRGVHTGTSEPPCDMPEAHTSEAEDPQQITLPHANQGYRDPSCDVPSQAMPENELDRSDVRESMSAMRATSEFFTTAWGDVRNFYRLLIGVSVLLAEAVQNQSTLTTFLVWSYPVSSWGPIAHCVLTGNREVQTYPLLCLLRYHCCQVVTQSHSG